MKLKQMALAVLGAINAYGRKNGLIGCMILDKSLQFDPSATAASGIVTGGVDSTNTLDLVNARDIQGGTQGGASPEVVFTVGAAFAATGGAASLIIGVQASVDNTNWYVIGQTLSGGIPKANLTAGAQIRLPLPAAQAENPVLPGIPRYYKCTYTAATNNFTSGTFECDLVVNPQTNIPALTYPAGVTVAN